MKPFMARMIAYLALGLSLAVAALVLLAPALAFGGLVRPSGLILAGFGFLAGLWVITKSYVQRPGFVVSPQWAAVFADVMFTLASGAMAFGLLEYSLAELLGVRPILEEGVQVVMSWMFLPATTFMALFAANMASQSLEVDQEGLTWYGPGVSRFVLWDDVQGLELQDSHVVVSRGGGLMPRRLQTKLVIKAPKGDIHLYEPSPRRAKREIVAALRRQAPPRLRPDLERIARRW